MDWTAQQLSAIEARGGALLVSAAAGSGKTAVLVERVIRRLLDENDPCSAENLLIVTFTRAATSQMREKIAKVLDKKIKEDPTNRALLRQQFMLPFAKICTIDGFCGELVRENFVSVGLSPDFTMLDASQKEMVHSDAVSAVAEKLYQENSPEFSALVEQLYNGRDDSLLIKVIFELWEKACAYPFPEEYLDSLLDDYNPDIPVEQTVWGKTVKSYILSALDYCVSCMQSAVKLLEEDEICAKAYLSCFVSDTQALEKVREAVQNGSWDDALKKVHESVNCFGKLGRTPSGYESDIKSKVTLIRNEVKDIVKKKLASLMCVTSEEHKEDTEHLRPIVAKLVEAVKMYGKELYEIKKELNAYEFSDIEHFAVELLIERTPEGYKKTDLAEELSQKYAEILIDEYQDVNKSQDMLFEALSRKSQNLFVVGDVKQCIYRFRQAMPEIFLERREALPPFKDTAPAKIILDRNFRSRVGVAGTANFIFSQIMSEQVGEIDYHGEELVAAAKYPEHSDNDAEIHILDIADEAAIDAESRYIAQLIERMINDGFTVSDGEDVRPAVYSDFCILTRSDSGRFAAYAKALSEKGIPSNAAAETSFFEAKEINFVLSLLKVIDNPTKDIPLVAVLLSPEFGFSPDELARIRLTDKKASLFACMKIKADSGDEKSSKFLSAISFYRRLSAALSVTELIQRVIDDTGCRAVAAALPRGETRRINLDLLVEYAANYESFAKGGLPGFIRFIDKLSENPKSLKLSSSAVQSANCVNIMSIHKSKGLEFPVCILSNCSGKFNTEDTKADLIVSSDTGVGMYRADSRTNSKFQTLPRVAAKLSVEASLKSEEMRVLYVAMTRAKEKLIVTVPEKDPYSKLRKTATLNSSQTVSEFVVGNASCYSDWILPCIMKHPDAQNIRTEAGIGSEICLPAETGLTVIMAGADDNICNPCNESKESALPLPDESIVTLAEERLGYVYPYSGLSGVAAKHSASELSHSGAQNDFFASCVPAFMSKSGLSSAQRGTAMHSFMQYMNHSCACADLEAEIERLIIEGRLSKEEADSLNRRLLKKYFESSLAQRINNAHTIFKEKKFTLQIPAYELHPDLPDNVKDEKVIIQGIVDCAFIEKNEAVIVDYKTDRVDNPEELLSRYSSQLKIYKRAFEECVGIPVREMLIYSFTLGRDIEVAAD